VSDRPSSDRPEDEEDFHPGWHGTLLIAEANMATEGQLMNDATKLDALADTGYYDNTEDSGELLRQMAAWLRRMATRGQ